MVNQTTTCNEHDHGSQNEKFSETIKLPNTTPKKGQEFDSEEEAYAFYNEYGRNMGFSVRLDYANRHKVTNELTSRRFTCSKEGERGKDKRDNITRKARAETRVKCGARMTISLRRSTGKYKVIDFVPDHNHLLHLACCSHMMPSQRKMTEAHITQINLADDSGIKPKEAHEFLSRQVGGQDNLGHTHIDHKNYLREKRQNNLQYGEAGSLLRYFQRKSLAESSFFYRIQLDKEEQITNIFWADSKMIMDYAHFGDVVSFDTTFGTNNQSRPFGVFVGFNHHRETVVFGAALLYDETIPSFEWLFETFLEVHNGRKPRTIFTDQDAAMANALSSKMSETRHGLCIWHIMHNIKVKHLKRVDKDGNFLQDFRACMFECEDAIHFETKWQSLVRTHHLSNDPWAKSIYSVRDKWAKVYMKMTFDIGMRSTQLSESLNSDLKDYLGPKLDITRFFHHFERVVEYKRYKETEAEYNCREKLPKIKMKNSPMLNQAAKVYTTSIFDLFQEEYDDFQGTFFRFKDESQATHEYLVTLVGKDYEYKVFGNRHENTVSCNCRKFETFGILCSHALKVLDAMDIKLIPEQYIIKRWTKDARSEIVQDIRGATIQSDSKLKISERYRVLCPGFVKIVTRGVECEEASTFLANEMIRLSKTVDDICNKKKTSNGHNEEVEDNRESPDLLLMNVKGFKRKTNSRGQKNGKRHKSWDEKLGDGNKVTLNKKKGKMKLGAKPLTLMPTNDPVPVISQNYITCQVDEISYPEIHSSGQTYTDLLVNGVRTYSKQVFVGESQIYPSSSAEFIN